MLTRLTFFILMLISTTSLQAQAFSEEIEAAILSSIVDTKINDVVLELASYCPIGVGRISNVAQHLKKLQFMPVQASEGYEESVQFVRTSPARSVVVKEGKFYKNDTSKAVWVTICGVTAGGELSEKAIRAVLSSFDIDPSHSKLLMSEDMGEMPNATGWTIPPSGDDAITFTGWTGSLNGQVISSFSVGQRVE